jgi:hypothetical protein
MSCLAGLAIEDGIFSGLGHGGQVIAIFADLDLVIVTTAQANQDWVTAGQQTDGIMMIIRDEVLPAVLDN